MTKAELVYAISRKTGLDKADVEIAVEALFEVIKSSLVNGKTIYLRGFGNFQNKKRARRTARNITKNTSVTVEAHDYPSFKPSKLFIEEMRK